MKKKAIIKTILDILKVLGLIIGGTIILTLALYLFAFIPYWVLNILDLWETYKDMNASIIYMIELAVILFIISMYCFISQLYCNNLEKLKNEQTD